MKEDFLHFVWEQGQYDPQHLSTTGGKPVTVFDPGRKNPNAGPDFLNARILLDNVNWVGNVEIHVRSGDWYKHGHHRDPVYNSTVLHVCFREDEQAFRQDLSPVPCIELQHRIPVKVRERFDQLANNTHWIPCAPFRGSISESLSSRVIRENAYDRLLSKSQAMVPLLKRNAGDWESTFYMALAGGFGGHINRDPFVQLAETIPYRLIRKYRHKPAYLEAMFFGAGGFLNIPVRPSSHPYVRDLVENFAYLKALHKMNVMDASRWKFLRMRPANFPSVRLAQFCAVLARQESLFPFIRENPGLEPVMELLDVDVAPYWQTHYMLDGQPSAIQKNLGTGMKHEIVINVVAPVLYLYGSQTGNRQYQHHAKDLLDHLPAEKNKITSEFNKLNFKAKSAYDSQGLLQLYRKRCTFKACIACGIGTQILKREIKIN